jgi:hypothetical protein
VKTKRIDPLDIVAGVCWYLSGSGFVIVMYELLSCWMSISTTDLI